MPASGVALIPKASILTFHEILTLAVIFVKLGVRKIRITGGEPLVRPHIESLCAGIANIGGLREFALSTNGLLLEDKLPALWQAGVRQLNISLDSLRPERFERITRRDNFKKVLSAIRAAVQFHSNEPNGSAFDSVKINTVVMRGVNDDELLDFIRFGYELRLLVELAHRKFHTNPPAIEVRFIEFMPFPGNSWSEQECLPYSEMRRIIGSEFTLDELPNAAPINGRSDGVQGPARSFKVRETGTVIGFITSISEHFCGDCNRLRLTANGMLRTCLFGGDDVNLRDLLRSGASTEDIEYAIHAALASKWEKHPEAANLVQISTREMVAIGG
jgi:molybdenum cofactor biosynthesis enzyme MoaA